MILGGDSMERADRGRSGCGNFEQGGLRCGSNGYLCMACDPPMPSGFQVTATEIEQMRAHWREICAGIDSGEPARASNDATLQKAAGLIAKEIQRQSALGQIATKLFRELAALLKEKP